VISLSASKNLTSALPQASYWTDMREFKEVLCDENRLIIEALRTKCKPWLQPPILDVGAGLGDIAAAAFPEMDAVLLDLNRMPEARSPRHKSIQDDFFSYSPQPNRQPRTALLCHVLQHLDDDELEFCRRIEILDPQNLITVTNDNDGSFGEFIDWAKREIPDANPEASAPPIDKTRYQVVTTVPILATLRCPDFETMAGHLVTGLLDASVTTKTVLAVVQRLSALLKVPEIVINQTMRCYEKSK
jgi:hypothetical protein